jgi:hypothetical protein
MHEATLTRAAPSGNGIRWHGRMAKARRFRDYAPRDRVRCFRGNDLSCREQVTATDTGETLAMPWGPGGSRETESPPRDAG